MFKFQYQNLIQMKKMKSIIKSWKIIKMLWNVLQRAYQNIVQSKREQNHAKTEAQCVV